MKGSTGAFFFRGGGTSADGLAVVDREFCAASRACCRAASWVSRSFGGLVVCWICHC